MSDSEPDKTDETREASAPLAAADQMDAETKESQPEPKAIDADAKKREIVEGFITRVVVPILVEKYLIERRKTTSESQMVSPQQAQEPTATKKTSS
jgi:hypothetical protein